MKRTKQYIAMARSTKKNYRHMVDIGEVNTKFNLIEKLLIKKGFPISPHYL